MPILLRWVPSRLLWLGFAILLSTAGAEATFAGSAFHWTIALGTMLAIVSGIAAMAVASEERPQFVALALVVLPQLLFLWMPVAFWVVERHHETVGWGLIMAGFGCLATALMPSQQPAAHSHGAVGTAVAH